MKDENIKNHPSNQNSEEEREKIEICYICGVKFNINEDDDSHYHYDKYPMCGYCSEFYGFYNKDL